MKKIYMQPTVKVVKLQPRKMLMTSDFAIKRGEKVNNYEDLE